MKKILTFIAGNALGLRAPASPFMGVTSNPTLWRPPPVT